MAASTSARAAVTPRIPSFVTPFRDAAGRRPSQSAGGSAESDDLVQATQEASNASRRIVHWWRTKLRSEFMATDTSTLMGNFMMHV